MQDVPASLSERNRSMSTGLSQAERTQSSVLGTLCFSLDADVRQLYANTEVPCLHVPMQRLDAVDSVCEVWASNGEPTPGVCGAIHYRHDEAVLFGVMTLDEARFEPSADKTPLQQATESAYHQVFSLLDSLQYPYPLRFWNYIANINAHSFGLERYRQFNLGRWDAFQAHGRDVGGGAPAACAVGFEQREAAPGPLTIAFLAGRVAPRSIENPRQISAYQYPQQYGPRSPTFSRASLVELGKDEVLFVSGTASIVGHATVHAADVVAQTHETMANISAVLAEANRVAQRSRFALADLHYRVYVRRPADLPQIRAELTRCVGDSLKAVYFQADVCRADLLLEIEAIGGYSFVSMSTPGRI